MLALIAISIENLQKLFSRNFEVSRRCGRKSKSKILKNKKSFKNLDNILKF